jgi:hypothetical protein
MFFKPIFELIQPRYHRISRLGPAPPDFCCSRSYGVRVNRLGASKHANTPSEPFDNPVAPVYIDGKLSTRLKGYASSPNFNDILDN